MATPDGKVPRGEGHIDHGLYHDMRWNTVFNDSMQNQGGWDIYQHSHSTPCGVLLFVLMLSHSHPRGRTSVKPRTVSLDVVLCVAYPDRERVRINLEGGPLMVHNPEFSEISKLFVVITFSNVVDNE